jgi:peptidoglycan/xylan/chitin deacetylase (PgdA/CDA1 family)
MRKLATAILIGATVMAGLSTTAAGYSPSESHSRVARARRPIPAATPTATPAPRTEEVATSLIVPVLMYHYISTVPRDEIGNPLSQSLRLSPRLFAQQLDFLVEQGYHTVTTPQLWAALTGAARLPAKPIVLTFDDGYEDAFANALPLLLERGLVGTFFVTVNLVGRPGYLTWDQVRALAADGMDVQSHAMDHISMAKLSGGALFAQLAESRRILSERTGTDVRFFAYPCGEYNAATRTAAAAAGYHAAFAKDGGAYQSTAWAYALRRSRITGSLTGKGLGSLLAGL